MPCHPWCTHRTSLVVKKKKILQFSCDCEKFHYVISFGFLVINVYNHGEHYEKPCSFIFSHDQFYRYFLILLQHHMQNFSVTSELFSELSKFPHHKKTTLHYTTLHCTRLHCTALHYTTLHYKCSSLQNFSLNSSLICC